MKRIFTSALSLTAVLCLFGGGVNAATFHAEKLGPMPAANIDMETDLKLWADKINELEQTGFACDASGLRKTNYHMVAVVPTSDAKCRMWIDGRKGPVYDQIRNLIKGKFSDRDIRFSPDGRHVAYTARKGSKWLMVVDGVEGPVFDGIREPYYSTDSKHIGYVGFRGDKSILVVDGKESPAYPGIRMDFPYITETSPVRRVDDSYCPVIFSFNDHIAYVAIRGRDGGQQTLVLDGKEGPVYDSVKGISFSPDGTRAAYIAKKGEKSFVILDGKPGPKYDDIEEPLTFSPDGKRFAYTGIKYNASGDAQYHAVVDDKEGPKYADVPGPSLCFSPDSKHFAYDGFNGEEHCAVLDGKPGPKYEEIGSTGEGMWPSYLVFSPTSKLAYSAKRGEKNFMVIDGACSPAYESVSTYPIFSRDGAHYAYSARQNDRAFVVVDGVKGREYASVYDDTITFTADNRVVYLATSLDVGALIVVSGGKELTGAGNPAVSPDGKCLAYTISKNSDDENKTAAVLDGAESGRFMSVMPLSFTGDGTLEFLAVRDETTENGLSYQLYRVTAK